ncbi:MAG: transposase, partial [Cyanobacteriota bacterium]
LPFTNKQILYPSRRITIPGLGEFRLKRPIPYLCASQTFTVSRTGERWFVSFMLEADRVPLICHEVESIGIDLGVKRFATFSDGTTLTAPVSLKRAKIKLGKQQWKNRKKRHGNRRDGVGTSNNAKKFYRKIANRHAHIVNIRKDFLQKLTTRISRKYYRIRIEDLNVSGMIANHKLAEAVSSCGFYEFRQMLTYKESFYGTRVELVDRWYPSSKMCSECGNIQSMPLSERLYRCNQCKCEKDRDSNASINLEKAPLERVRRATAELTLADKKEPTPLVEAGNKRQNKRVK